MDFEQAIKELTELSKANGNTVFSNDILKYCGDDDQLNYEKIEAKLIENNIDVVPSKESIEDNEDEGPEVELNLNDVEEVDISKYDQLPTSIKVDDPVRMYLKDIGKSLPN